MAGSKADYLEDKILDHVLGGGDYTRPTDVFIALYTTAPGDAGGGVEVSGNGYGRVTVTNNLTNWPASSGGSKSNGASFDFATASGGNWGTIQAFAVLDAISAGNFLYWGTVTTPKDVNDGDTAKFPIGSITITED